MKEVKGWSFEVLLGSYPSDQPEDGLHSKRKITEEVMKGARLLDLCSEVDRSFHK